MFSLSQLAVHGRQRGQGMVSFYKLEGTGHEKPSLVVSSSIFTPLFQRWNRLRASLRLPVCSSLPGGRQLHDTRNGPGVWHLSSTRWYSEPAP